MGFFLLKVGPPPEKNFLDPRLSYTSILKQKAEIQQHALSALKNKSLSLQYFHFFLISMPIPLSSGVK